MTIINVPDTKDRRLIMMKTSLLAVDAFAGVGITAYGEVFCGTNRMSPAIISSCFVFATEQLVDKVLYLGGTVRGESVANGKNYV